MKKRQFPINHLMDNIAQPKARAVGDHQDPRLFGW
jgi:hypothetical protein